MKTIIFILLLGFVFACKTPVKVTSVNEPQVELQENADSMEYELWVLDPQFSSWFAAHLRPGYHSLQYYRMWNLRYATDWNTRYFSGGYHNYFELPIEYDPNIDYGLEVEEELYYYFVYVEQKLKIPILFGYHPRPVY